MTDDEIRIAVATEQGWMCIGPCTCGHKEPCGLHPDPHRASGRIHLPNYPEDLNAMHEVEKTLPLGNVIGGTVVYNNTLMRICGSHQQCVTATARQRCEAYLRTIGKWID